MANTIDTEKARSSIDVQITVNGTIYPAVSDVPDLGTTPEQIDVTAIGEDTRAYIQGIEDPGELEFTCFYEKTIYDALKALESNKNVPVVINIGTATGNNLAGKISINGEISVSLSGFGVGDAISFVLKVTPSSLEWTKTSSTTSNPESGGKEPGTSEE